MVAGLFLVLAACAQPPARIPLSGDEQRVEQILRVAEQTEARGDFPTSAGLYLRAHEILPQRVEPLLRLAALQERLGASDKAAEAYRRVLAITPDAPDVLRAYGLTLLAQGQTEAAVEQFHRALMVAEDPRLYNALGAAYDRLGARQTAQAYYLVGLELAPAHLSLNANLALSLALSGHQAESLAVLDRVAAAAAASPTHRRMVAIAYGLAGNETVALRVGAPDMGREELRRSLANYRNLGVPAASLTPQP